MMVSEEWYMVSLVKGRAKAHRGARDVGCKMKETDDGPRRGRRWKNEDEQRPKKETCIISYCIVLY